MITNSFRTSLFLGAAAICVASAAPVWAQKAASARPTAAASSADANGSSDIIVTARRMEERLQDVPISITVLNQQDLANRNIVNAQDLAISTPSLSSNNNFGSDNSTFAIRGFVQDIGTAPSVGVYFADVVAPRGGSLGFPSGDGAGSGAFFDLQNVQVLKGPQGTLQGRNTTGGAVMLVPQKPTRKLEGYVEGSVGNFNMRRIQAVLNVPVTDTLRVRLGVDRQKRDGYLHNIAVDQNGNLVGPSNFDDVNYVAVRASVVADLTPNLENYTIGSYSRSDTNGSLQKTIASGDPAGLLGGLAYAQLTREQGAGFYDATSSLPNARTVNQQWQIINTTTWRAADNLTVKNIVSYAELKEDLNTALFGSNFFTPSYYNFFAPGTGGLPVYFAVITQAPGYHTAHEATFTEEFQLQGRAMEGRLNWQAGVYYEKATPLGFVGNQTNVLGNCTNIATFQCSDPIGQFYTAAAGFPIHIGASNFNIGEQGSKDIGIYTQSTYSLTDKLKLTAGLRYTWDTETGQAIQKIYEYSAPNTPFFASCTQVNQYTDANCLSTFPAKHSQAPTWTIDLEYKPTDDILAYVKYTRGYRTGTLKVDAPSAFIFTNPEKVDTYELGLKSAFHSFISGTFNVTGFYNDFSNQQILLGLSAVPGSGAQPSAAPINVGKSRIYGLEAEANVKLFQGFTVDAAYTYLNTRVQQVTLPSAASILPYFFGQGVKVGDVLALSPKNKYTITAAYMLPLDEKVGKVSLSATFTHTDSQRTAYSGRGYVAYVPTPSGLVQTTQDLEILQATNLLNLNVNWNTILGSPVDLSFFATNVTKAKYLSWVTGLLGNGFETASVGPPRMYGMRAKVHF